MTKDNVLYSIIGVLLGFIIGFLFANYANQRGAAPPVNASQVNPANLPPDHPPIDQASGGQSAAAMADVQQAVKLAKDQPNSFDAQLNAARLYAQIKRHDESIEYLMKANQLKPDNYEVIVNLGNENFDANHFEQAEKWYLAALATKPDDVNVRTDLGLTFMFREPANLDRAIEEFRGSLKREPNHLQTLQNLTVAYIKKGNSAEAQATLKQLESVDPGSEIIARLRDDISKIGTTPTPSKSSINVK
jgi:tetratricopeptide (TPR) repeat protein